MYNMVLWAWMAKTLALLSATDFSRCQISLSLNSQLINLHYIQSNNLWINQQNWWQFKYAWNQYWNSQKWKQINY